MTVYLKKRPHAPCGTYGGYQHHRRVNGTPCEPCRTAAARYRKDYRAASAKAKERDRKQARAYAAASAALRERYFAEFQELYRREFESICGAA